jgi:RNA polymerase sigma factor (sigma-70 family)
MLKFLEEVKEKREKDLRTDEELFLSFKKGNREDGGMLLVYYLPKIKKWIADRLGRRNDSDADDVVQDVLLHIIELKEKFNDLSPGAFNAWMWQIVFLSHKTALRKKFSGKFSQTEKPNDIYLFVDRSCVNVDDLIDNVKSVESLDVKQMKVVLNLLPEKQKKALTLHFTQQTSIKQRCKEMNIPERSFWLCVQEAKENCRHLWEMIQDTIPEAELAKKKKFIFLAPLDVAKMLDCRSENVCLLIRKGRLQAYRFRNKIWKIRPEWVKEYKKYYGKPKNYVVRKSYAYSNNS